MPRQIRKYIYEGSDYVISFLCKVDTENATISVRAHEVNNTDATSTLLGTTQGKVADQVISVKMNTSSLSPSKYYLEFYANFGEVDQIVLNNDFERTLLIVQEMGAI